MFCHYPIRIQFHLENTLETDRFLPLRQWDNGPSVIELHGHQLSRYGFLPWFMLDGLAISLWLMVFSYLENVVFMGIKKF